MAQLLPLEEQYTLAGPLFDSAHHVADAMYCTTSPRASSHVSKQVSK